MADLPAVVAGYAITTIVLAGYTAWLMRRARAARRHGPGNGGPR